MAKKSKVPLAPAGGAVLVQVGHFSFLAGAAVAILSGIASFVVEIDTTFLLSILFVLGVVVGVLNVTVKETTRFLVACIALILAGVVNLALIPYVGQIIQVMLRNIVVFVVPAAIIGGLRAVWLLAKEK